MNYDEDSSNSQPKNKNKYGAIQKKDANPELVENQKK